MTSGQECNSDVGNCLDCPCLVPCPSIPCSVIQYPLACSFLMFLAVAVKDKVGGGRTTYLEVKVKTGQKKERQENTKEKNTKQESNKN